MSWSERDSVSGNILDDFPKFDVHCTRRLEDDLAGSRKIERELRKLASPLCLEENEVTVDNTTR